MVGKAGIILFCILMAITGGCANGPVFTVDVYETPTPYQSDSDLLIATPGPFLPVPSTTIPASVSTVLPEFTQAVPVLPADFSPILYGERYDANTFFFLLGGVQAGHWLTADQAASYLQGTMEYDVFTSGGANFQVLGYAPESSPIHPGRYLIGSDSTLDEIGMVGVKHGWAVQMGKAEELSAEIEMYRQAVLDWLKSQGLKDPQLGVLHLFRIDLEGDGVDEILISATHLDESQHTTRAGDYSVVLLRRVAGNEVVTLPLVADIYRSKEADVTYPSTYTLANFIDLNQDGILEIVVDFHRWEGDGAMIYTMEEQNITRIP